MSEYDRIDVSKGIALIKLMIYMNVLFVGYLYWYFLKYFAKNMQWLSWYDRKMYEL